MVELRERVLKLLRAARDPRGLAYHEIAEQVGGERRDRHRVRTLLVDLVDDGLLERSEGARYRPVGWIPTPPEGARPAAPGTTVGRLRVHPAGYGFVEREDQGDDVFVPARHRGAALDGDRVALATWGGHQGTEGRVVAILARGRARLTGTLRAGGRVLLLEPDDPRILGSVVITGFPAGAHPDHVVVAEITRYPEVADGDFEARVVRVLGAPGDLATEVAKVIAGADLPEAFPEAALVEAASFPPTVTAPGGPGRLDLRHLPFLTIDPVTARDFDDAVCVEDGPRPGLDRLWVAVADVSHYVRPGSALDEEALRRGVSVYLPDRAIPMLPPALSSHLCSLIAEQDRLALVARLDLDSDGEVVEESFAAAVIRAQARLDYPGVALALEGDLRGERERYTLHLPQLRRLHEVARRLRARRDARGALDFDLPEAEVLLDEDDPKRVRDVRRARSSPAVRGAYRLVEDLMLAANEAVARFFQRRSLPTLWRVHEPPRLPRLLEVSRLAEHLGVVFPVDEAQTPKGLRELLASVQGRPFALPLSYLILRALAQASYDLVNVGHFGLAAPAYLHFTSPIRRYPDLVVHRLLKQRLAVEGQAAGDSMEEALPDERLAHFARESSRRERRAMQAEREVVDVYRAVLLRDRLGDEFAATVSGVTSFGLFVAVDEPYVEGLIKLDRLPGGPWEFDEGALRLSTRGRSFTLGDALRVRLIDLSVERRRLDFALVEGSGDEPPFYERRIGGRKPRRARSRS